MRRYVFVTPLCPPTTDSWCSRIITALSSTGGVEAVPLQILIVMDRSIITDCNACRTCCQGIASSISVFRMLIVRSCNSVTTSSNETKQSFTVLSSKQVPSFSFAGKTIMCRLWCAEKCTLALPSMRLLRDGNFPAVWSSWAPLSNGRPSAVVMTTRLSYLASSGKEVSCIRQQLAETSGLSLAFMSAKMSGSRLWDSLPRGGGSGGIGGLGGV